MNVDVLQAMADAIQAEINKYLSAGVAAPQNLLDRKQDIDRMIATIKAEIEREILSNKFKAGKPRKPWPGY